MSEPSQTPKDKEPVGQKPEGPRSVPGPTPSERTTSSERTTDTIRPAPKQQQPPAPEQLVITLSGDTGEISRVEVLEAAGRRRELTPEEYVELASEDDAGEIEALIEEVYRTAVADALGQPDEGDDEIKTRSLFVGRLFVRRMLRRGVHRLLLLRLLDEEMPRTKTA